MRRNVDDKTRSSPEPKTKVRCSCGAVVAELNAAVGIAPAGQSVEQMSVHCDSCGRDMRMSRIAG